MEDLPPLVGGGWFGWLGYRLAARVENVPLATERPAPLPDFQLAYYDNVLRQDLDGVWWFESLATPGRAEALAQRLAHLHRRVEDAGRGMVRADSQAQPGQARADQAWLGHTQSDPATPRPSPLRLSAAVAEHHLWAVAQCVQRIAAGDIFQANICLRLDGEFDGTATQLLGVALAAEAPLSQYTAAFDTPEGSILSLSPRAVPTASGPRCQHRTDQGHRATQRR